VRLREVALRILRLLLLIDLFGCLNDLICKASQSVIVQGLVLFLEVKDADLVLESFELSWPGLVLLVVVRPLYVGHGVVQLFLSLLLEVLGRSD
jgi:hypothetical protein